MRSDPDEPPGARDRWRIGQAERGGCGCRGPGLGAGQLGMPVQIMPEFDSGGQLGGQQRSQR